MNGLPSLLSAVLCASLAPAQSATESSVRRDVSFPSAGVSLAGHLYLPPGASDGQRLPAVVVTGAWTTVKEQMPTVYAKAMAERGFAALVFDFRGFGESGGTPKFLEDPVRKTADIVAAAAFLSSRPEVDASRVAGLGVCASAGYMSQAAVTSSHLRAVGLVAPWLHDPAIAEAVYGGAENVSKLIAKGRAAAASKEPQIVVAASRTDEHALMYQVPYYTEPERGLIAAYDNKFNVASWEPWLTYDGVAVGDALRKPTLAVHSRAAVIPQGITEFARRMGEHARVSWLDDVSQFDFYDQPEPVRQAADEVAAHFRSTFDAQQDVAAVTSVVEGLLALVDLRKFEALESLFAPEVRIDYSSLFGAPAESMTAAALIRGWAGVLPGYDRTRHALSNVHVAVTGQAARLTADVIADHYVGESFWQVRGRYVVELVRQGRRWQIRALTLEVDGESGSRDVLEVAIAKAAAAPVRPVIRLQAEAAIRAFLETLESKDMTAFANVWADGAVQEMPFAPPGFPKEVRGRDKILAHYASWPQVSGAAEFTDNLQFFPMQDPHWVFATFTGRVDVVPTGRLYEQTYGGLFRVRDGKIELFREYFNPLPFARAFGLSLEQSGAGK